MLDIALFQTGKGGDPEMIKKSQEKRGDSVELVDEVIADYTEWTKGTSIYNTYIYLYTLLSKFKQKNSKMMSSTENSTSLRKKLGT